MTIGYCTDPGSEGWTIAGLPSNGAAITPPPAGPNIGLIVGIAVGCAAAIAAFGAVLHCVLKSKNPDAIDNAKKRAPSISSSENDIKDVLESPKDGLKGAILLAAGPNIPSAQPNGSETAVFSDVASVDTDASSVLSRKTYGSTLSSSFSLTSSVDPSRESYPYGYNSLYNRPPETRITSSLLDSSRVVDRTGREVKPKHMDVMPKIPPPSPTFGAKQLNASSTDLAAASRAAAGGPPSSPSRAMTAPTTPTMSRTMMQANQATDSVSTKSGKSGKSGKSSRSRATSQQVPASLTSTAVGSDSPGEVATPATLATINMPLAPISTTLPPAVAASVAAAMQPSSAASSPIGPESPVTPSNPYYQFINPDKVHRALKPYKATESDELSLQPGDLVRVETAFRDGWGRCWLVDPTTGAETQSGMTPLGFLDPVGIPRPTI